MMMILETFSKAENPCHVPGIDTPGDDIRMVEKNNFEECKRACSEEERFVH